MPTTVVRYRTKPDRANENQRLVEEVFAELAERPLPGLRYVSFRLADGVSFVHIAASDEDATQKALVDLDAFQQFAAGLPERCVEPPDPQAATVVGSCNLAFG